MSVSQYIIICKGRIDYQTASSPAARIRALSDVATNLVSHIDIRYPGKLTNEDTEPISRLQHFLMANQNDITGPDIEAKAVEMFALLDALEEKFE